MWKSVARGIRETIERRACRTNVYSQSSSAQETNEVKNSLTCNPKIQQPAVTATQTDLGYSATSGGPKDNRNDQEWNARHTWCEAIGWSSLLAVGWVVCQHLCLRKTLIEQEKRDSFRKRLSQLSEAHLKYLFGPLFNLERKHVLPIIYCAGKTNQNSPQEEIASGWIADKPFGPITVEEALKEATDELANMHNYAIGQYEHVFGMKAIEDKRYKDAVQHFAAGAKLSSSSSMFNLGVCYELGLGINADEKKAVKYYMDAADRDHADAMYNLGVFCAQGRGGLTVDVNRAHSYFVKAAKLGQMQAQHALDLERQYNNPVDRKNDLFSQNTRDKPVGCVVNRDDNSTALLSKLAGYSNTSNICINSEPIAEPTAYGQTSYESKNPTDIFLELLGFKDSSLLSIPVVANDCKVSC